MEGPNVVQTLAVSSIDKNLVELWSLLFKLTPSNQTTTAFKMNRIFSKLATQREVFAKDQQLEQLITELTVASESTHFSLVTTPKTQIIDNKILLPSKPRGDFIFNLMRVFDMNNDCGEYDNVTVFTDENGINYAVLNEPEEITGHGVVSYLEMTSL